MSNKTDLHAFEEFVKNIICNRDSQISSYTSLLLSVLLFLVFITKFLYTRLNARTQLNSTS